jgi:hypothetical protein
MTTAKPKLELRWTTLAILAGLGSLVLSWIFPPWQKTWKHEGRIVRVEHVGPVCLFDMPQREIVTDSAFSIDVSRLVLVDLCIAAISAGAAITLNGFEKSRQATGKTPAP